MNVQTQLMFQDDRAREAAEWYVSPLPGSQTERVVDNGEGGVTVHFTLRGRGFIAFDGAVPMRVDDHGFSSCFGLATDQYGVSWQIGTADRELADS